MGVAERKLCPSGQRAPLTHPLIRRKTRIISLRVTEEEYDTLLRVAEESGAASVSSYLRSRAFGAPDGADTVASDIADLRSQLARLESFVGMEKRG